MWLGSGERVAAPIQKPDLSGQHDMLFNDIYQEVRCAALLLSCPTRCGVGSSAWTSRTGAPS